MRGASGGGQRTPTRKNDVVVLLLQEVLRAGEALAWHLQKTKIRPEKRSGSGALEKRPRPCQKSSAAGTKFTCFTGTKVQMLTSCQTSAAGPQEEEDGPQSARCWEGTEHTKEKEQSACLRRACGSCKRRRKELQSNVIEP